MKIVKNPFFWEALQKVPSKGYSIMDKLHKKPNGPLPRPEAANIAFSSQNIGNLVSNAVLSSICYFLLPIFGHRPDTS
jgi:hypothetical protein